MGTRHHGGLHPNGRGDWHDWIHVARTGTRASGGRQKRHLQSGCRDARDDCGVARVQRRNVGIPFIGAPPRRSAAAADAHADDAAWRRTLRDALSGKRSRRRYQSAADFDAVLEDLREDLATDILLSTESAAAAATFRRRVRRPLALGAIVLALGGVAGFIAASRSQASVAPTPTYRPFITEMSVNNPVWSPDGRTLAYTVAINGQPQIFLRGSDAAESTQVTKQAAIGGTAFWSPDSTRIYFSRVSDGKLVSVSAGGGEPQPVAMRLPAGTADENSTPAGGMNACITPDGRTIVPHSCRRCRVPLMDRRHSHERRTSDGSGGNAEAVDQRAGPRLLARWTNARHAGEHHGTERGQRRLADLLARRRGTLRVRRRAVPRFQFIDQLDARQPTICDERPSDQRRRVAAADGRHRHGPVVRR